MEINTKSILEKYNSNYECYKFLAETVHYLIQREVSKHKKKVHSINHRIKTLDSLLDKTRRNNILDPFEQIHDVVGVRIVCLFLPDLEEIGEIIRTKFDVFDEENKVYDTELNIFGYMSLHLKAKLKSSFETDSNEEIKKIPFEVQVRTIAQDAWASISHYLDYKKENIFPKELKRDFHALSGLFYVADTHFSWLRQEQSKYYFEEVNK